MLGVIINTKAGKRSYLRQRYYLFDLLKSQQMAYTYHITRYAGHASELSRMLVEQGYDRLLVLGGDGTLSEVINGVMHASLSDKSHISVGLMPRGTGNDWGRYWGLDKDYKKSLARFFSGTPHPIDVGCLTLRRAGVEEKHYFVNSVGFGIDARTCERAQVLKYYVGSHGLNYFFGLLSAVFTHRSIPVLMQVEHDVTESGECSRQEWQQPLFTMNIGNGPFSGGGIRQNPDADPTDGLFHAMFVTTPSFKDIMRALPKLFNGRLPEVEFIRNFTAQRVLIQTDEHIVIEKDGILVDACGPYEVSLIPHALNFIA
ncbi:MAG: hypothetical protein IJS13_00715 [Paludibacteraceae bacterium]|nr:hypothetical protein [Paludibacteraceae bacterium]